MCGQIKSINAGKYLFLVKFVRRFPHFPVPVKMISTNCGGGVYGNKDRYPKIREDIKQQ